MLRFLINSQTQLGVSWAIRNGRSSHNLLIVRMLLQRVDDLEIFVYRSRLFAANLEDDRLVIGALDPMGEASDIEFHKMKSAPDAPKDSELLDVIYQPPGAWPWIIREPSILLPPDYSLLLWTGKALRQIQGYIDAQEIER